MGQLALHSRQMNALLLIIGVAALLVTKGLAHEIGDADEAGHSHSPTCGHNNQKNRDFLLSKQEEFQATRAKTMQMWANMEPAAARMESPDLNGPARRGFSSDGPIRILGDYDQLGSGATDNVIRQTVMPKAIAELRRRIAVKLPVSGRLRLPVQCTRWYMLGDQILCTRHDATPSDPGLCSFPDLGVKHSWKYFGSYQHCEKASASSCTNYPAQEGAPDTDFIIYVTSREIACSGSMLAYAGACKQDPVTGRPLAGYVNFCPSATANSPEQTLLDTAVHELLHALFFTDTLMESYIDDRGKEIGRDNVFTTDYAGRKSVKTPMLLSQAQQMFRCPSVSGIPLEDAGGGGSSSSHWEMAHIQGDVMTASASQLDRVQFGPLTMALIDDTGWYSANWDAVGYTEFGKGSGCSFLGESCSDFASSNPNQRFFCSVRGEFSCSHDNRYMSSCSEKSSYHPGCKVHSPFLTSGANAVQANSHCFDPSNHEDSSRFGFYYGYNSRCLPVDSRLEYVERPKVYFRDSAMCLKMSCTSTGLLQVTIEGSTLDCPTGALVDLTGIGSYKAGVLGPCPDNAAICNTLTCPNDCSGHGTCHGGVCYCFLGYAGTGCASEVCTPGSCLSGDCDASTGLCSDSAKPSTGPSPPPSPPQLHVEMTIRFLDLQASDIESRRPDFMATIKERVAVAVMADVEDVSILSVAPANGVVDLAIHAGSELEAHTIHETSTFLPSSLFRDIYGDIEVLDAKIVKFDDSSVPDSYASEPPAPEAEAGRSTSPTRMWYIIGFAVLAIVIMVASCSLAFFACRRWPCFSSKVQELPRQHKVAVPQQNPKHRRGPAANAPDDRIPLVPKPPVAGRQAFGALEDRGQLQKQQGKLPALHPGPLGGPQRSNSVAPLPPAPAARHARLPPISAAASLPPLSAAARNKPLPALPPLSAAAPARRPSPNAPSQNQTLRSKYSKEGSVNAHGQPNRQHRQNHHGQQDGRAPARADPDYGRGGPAMVDRTRLQQQ